MKWLYETFKKNNVASAVLHMDGQTPYMCTSSSYRQ
ncbi:hypothetical protein [Phocaeicola sp.]